MTAPADPPSGDHHAGSGPAQGDGRSAAPQNLDMLTAEARYHRQRYDLYRAKMYGPSDTSPSRLRELQRSCESAESRLAAAKAARRAQLAEPAE